MITFTVLSAIVIVMVALFFSVLANYKKEMSTYVNIRMMLWEYFFFAGVRFLIGGIPGGFGVFLRMVFYPLFMKRIGKKVTIFEDVIIESPKNVSIGDFSHIGHDCYISGWGGITIGSWVRIATKTSLITNLHNSQDVDIPIKKQGVVLKPITIEDDVWIGVSSIIMPGVNIGRGSIISAGSVVFMNVPEYSVVAGNPSRIVKSRKATIKSTI